MKQPRQFCQGQMTSTFIKGTLDLFRLGSAFWKNSLTQEYPFQPLFLSSITI